MFLFFPHTREDFMLFPRIARDRFVNTVWLLLSVYLGRSPACQDYNRYIYAVVVDFSVLIYKKILQFLTDVFVANTLEILIDIIKIVLNITLRNA